MLSIIGVVGEGEESDATNGFGMLYFKWVDQKSLSEQAESTMATSAMNQSTAWKDNLLRILCIGCSCEEIINDTTVLRFCKILGRNGSL